VKSVKFSALITAALTLACSSAAFGTSVTPGAGIVTPIATTTLAGDTLLASETVTFVSNPAAFSGPLYSAVYAEGGAGSNLDFVYQFTNLAASTDFIDQIAVSSFGTFTTDVYYDTASGSIAPSSAQRTAGVLDFNFTTPVVGPGTESYLLVVKTNATTYHQGNVTLQDGTSSSPNLAYTPAPEPAQAGLLLGGLFATGLFVARKLRVRQS
jgi:hypothetical protein